jgi:hypothetical protein
VACARDGCFGEPVDERMDASFGAVVGEAAGGTGVWGAWRGFGLGVAVLCVLLRAYQIKRLCVHVLVWLGRR